MRKCLVLLLIVFVSTFSFGQNKVKFGLNGGLNYSSLRGNNSPVKLTPGISFLGGISFEYFIRENISINSNLNFEQKLIKENGYIYLTDQNGYSEVVKADTKINYNYLVLPIYAGYYFGSKKDFYVNGGFFVGYLLNSNFTSKKFNDKTDTTDLNKRIDSGLIFGFGKLFKLNENNDLKLELRENLGLVNTSVVKVYNDGTIKTNSINLILNWSFNL